MDFWSKPGPLIIFSITYAESFRPFSEEKKLYVFASHAHRDHWNPDIFSDSRLKNAVGFILGFDITEPFAYMAREEIALR